jgi:hypothetical protein
MELKDFRKLAAKQIRVSPNSCSILLKSRSQVRTESRVRPGSYYPNITLLHLCLYLLRVSRKLSWECVFQRLTESCLNSGNYITVRDGT